MPRRQRKGKAFDVPAPSLDVHRQSLLALLLSRSLDLMISVGTTRNPYIHDWRLRQVLSPTCNARTFGASALADLAAQAVARCVMSLLLSAQVSHAGSASWGVHGDTIMSQHVRDMGEHG